MGGASAVLSNRRALATAGLLALLLGYYASAHRLPNLPAWADVAFVALVVLPAVFALTWLALPVRRYRGLLPIALALVVLAVVFETGDFEILANFTKFAAVTTLAFWFLGYFESALWVALVALIIPGVDALSVWRGPTNYIIEERPEAFTALSFAFPLQGERQALVLWRAPLEGTPRGYDVLRDPGGKRNDEPVTEKNSDGEFSFAEADLDSTRTYRYTVVANGDGRHATSGDARSDATNDGPQRAGATTDARAPTALEIDSVDSSAKLGLPDVLFFALFLAAADAFRLRTRTTWLLMAASFGLTLAFTYVLYVNGLPALPLLAIAFLIANADLLWRQARRGRRDAAPDDGAQLPG